MTPSNTANSIPTSTTTTPMTVVSTSPTTKPVASTGLSDSLLGSAFLPFIIMGFFWLLVVRPHQKRQQKEIIDKKALLDTIKVNDEVITSSGILGKLVRLTEQYAVLEISAGYDMTVQRSSISKVLPKGTLKQI